MDTGHTHSETGVSPSLPLSSRTDRVRACTQCHKQKQKCDRENPCSNCVRRGIPDLCTWPVGQKRPLSRNQPTSNIENFSEGQRPRMTTSIGQSSVSPAAMPPRRSRQSSGRLFRARGAPSYHGESYFGLHSAASIMEGSTDLPSGVDIGRSRRTLVETSKPYRTERGPYALTWELLGSLPRRKAAVDHLVQRFLDELNPTFDAVHEESFMTQYAKFWDRKAGSDDLTTLDIRWLALLFIILAFAEHLNCPQPCSVEVQRDCEDSSLHYYWTARKALVIAPSFEGESPDLTRCGILVTRYLIHTHRISESWLTVSIAVRMAQAQGMHIDGEELGLPRKVVETRRRLWSQLYYLDRSIALGLGRPCSVNEKHCTTIEIDNIWVDELSNEEAAIAHPKPFSEPTPAIYLLFQQRLAIIIGSIQDTCFGMDSMASQSTIVGSYDQVLKHDELLLAWKDQLPSYYAIEDADTSMDGIYPYIHYHRIYLQMAYHFTRVTLHRAYIFRPSITDRFAYSRDVCLSSACADLKIKLGFHNPTMADRIKVNVAAFRLFNSALILGVTLVKDPQSKNSDAILEDLQAYCDKINSDTWSNGFGLAEVKIVELCIAQASRIRRDPSSASRREMSQIPQVTNLDTARDIEKQTDQVSGPGNSSSRVAMSAEELAAFWSSHYLPEPTEYEVWQDLVEDLATSSTSFPGFAVDFSC